jgi:hypothetical protein
MKKISTILMLAADHMLLGDGNDPSLKIFSCNAIQGLPCDRPDLGVAVFEASEAIDFYRFSFGMSGDPNEAMRGIEYRDCQHFRYACLHAASLLAKDMGV